MAGVPGGCGGGSVAGGGDGGDGRRQRYYKVGRFEVAVEYASLVEEPRALQHLTQDGFHHLGGERVSV